MYAAAVTVAFGLAWVGVSPIATLGGDGRAGKFVIDIAMLQCLGAGPNLLPISWSLSTEWIAYLLFPLLARWVLHRGAAATAMAGLAAYGVILLLCALPPGWSHIFVGDLRGARLDLADTTTPWPLLRCLAGFTTGLVAARAGQAWRPSRWAGQAAAWAVVLICAALPWTGAVDRLAVPCFGCLVVVLAHEDGQWSPARWFGSAPIHQAGVISYALYLTHLLVWAFVAPWAHRLGAAPLPAMAVAIVVAWICYRAIEQPGRRLFAGRPPARSVEIA